MSNPHTNFEATGTELCIRYVPIALLKANPRNARQHPKSQISQIALSIRSFGNNVPIIVDNDLNVICGHGRLLACQQLGLQKVPAILLEHLTKTQADAFALADNRLMEHSTWNEQMLGEILLGLSEQQLDFSIEATGFTLDEIDLHIESLSGQVDDPADQIPDKSEGAVVSQISDLWLMGKHRLLCGDATKREDIGRLMDGTRAAMTFADAPYNVNYGDSAKDKMRGTYRPILNDNLGVEFAPFLAAACANIISVTDGGIYIAMSSSELHTLYKAFTEAGGHWSTFIIWAKNTFTIGRADYQRQCEPILYGWRAGATHYWCGARDQGDVWCFDKPARNDLHPTQKPVELVMRTIRNSSERGGIVLDPFMGSGSTLIAAERTGRVCYGMELEPLYVDAAIRRWQKHTGESAVHAGTGRRFDDLTAEAGGAA